uniref:RNA helicase n=1 Tax=Magallana gigas TaxID=29159 RepID=K1PRG3_MAGGI
MSEDTLSFHEMGLDDRLLKAISQLGWSEPTPIQEKAIPLALDGKDILARARTGSGKTAAFCIPVIQKILTAKQTSSTEQCVKALVLTPTKELCHQAYRNLMAISQLGWSEPTPIQEKAIPLALDGKDILARARTGSGKTAAFCIPVIQKILTAKQTSSTEQCVKALVLTPTKELCHQAYKNLMVYDSTYRVHVHILRPMLMEKPDIIVATPTRALAHIKAGNLDLRQSLELLIIDEADLLFSFGYEDDVRGILSNLPKIYQAFLMSATLSEDVRALKRMVLHNAVILKLEESQLPEASQLTQYHIKCEEQDKFTLVYALMKLNLLRGKSIIFVNEVNRCYKLKLFLEQFAIPACVLNSELPVNSRTARGDNQGSALSFVSVKDMDLLGEDAMRMVTKTAIREARLKEIKQEMLASNKLKTYFEDNPRDLQVLRHDKSLHTVKVQKHLKNVPDYLVPQTLRHMRGMSDKPGKSKARRKNMAPKGPTKAEIKYKVGGNKRKADPLRSFESAGLVGGGKKKKKS